MDSANDIVSLETYEESVTTVVSPDGDVVQVKEKKKVRRRKRKSKVNSSTDEIDCFNSRNNESIDDENGDLEELLLQVVSLSVAERGLHGVKNDAKHIAENGVFSLPSTSKDEQAKAKKQKEKKKKIKNVLPSQSTKDCVNVVNEVLEFLEEISSSPVNGAAGPSVLDLVEAVRKPSVKPKQKKQQKKKNTLSDEAQHASGTVVPKKSCKSTSTVSTAKRNQGGKKEKAREKFDDYMSEEQAMAGLQDGTLILGVIRINQRNYKEAYIASPCGEEKDIVISGLKDRNRSLEGDEVVVMLHPEEKSKARENTQRNGKVVYIKEYVHPRLCTGHLQHKKKQLNTYVVFSPKDSRIPRLKIPVSTLPEEYMKKPEKYDNIIFQAKLTKWTEEVSLADGVIVGMVGSAGEVEVETVTLLLENNIDARPYPEEFKQYYPASPFLIPEDEFSKREDLRSQCIFTIDPLTARDLDDAVSLKNLPNGNFEVGVHISDVTYFVHYNTLLDMAVRSKATSVYLVQRVYHMLPEELCLMCSLIPGEDKLAFSVIYEMTPNAEVVSHRFVRSIIRSCSQFAYEHAQAIIDDPNKEWRREDFPSIYNGFGPKDCVDAIKNLYKLSVIMRKRRYDSGALRIDQPKLYFELDNAGMPVKWKLDKQMEANRLIEEFMLLANGSVAEHIYKAYPDLAFLRSHKPPQAYSMKVLSEKLSLFGIHLDVESAGGIHSSLMKYETFESDDVFSWARRAVMNNLCAKGMRRALYFCADGNDLSDFHHYALNVPFYTHFTSPIRRYADIMVHRLLGASLGVAPKPTWNKDYTMSVARNCNVQKYSAKVAGEQSSLLYLTRFLSHKGPIITYAAVIDVKDHSFDVILYGFCITLRIYTDKIEADITHSCNDGVTSLEIKWSCGRVQVIQLFSVVQIDVRKHECLLKLEGTLVPPLIPAADYLNSTPTNC